MKKVATCLMSCLTLAICGVGVMATEPPKPVGVSTDSYSMSPRFVSIVETIQDVYLEDGQLTCWGYAQCYQKSNISIRIKIQDRYEGHTKIILDKTSSDYALSFDVIESVPFQEGHYYTITFEYTAPGDNPSCKRYYY